MNYRTIPDYPMYRISESGDIQGFRAKSKKGYGWRDLRPCLKKNGYLQVNLYNENGRKTFRIHKLVALAWLEGNARGLVVNHKNGIKTDNRKENLEWVTISENTKHGWRELSRKHTKPNAKITENQANEIKERLTIELGKDLAKEYGLTHSAISHIKTGRNWKIKT